MEFEDEDGVFEVKREIISSTDIVNVTYNSIIVFKGKEDLHCNIWKTSSFVFNSNVSYIVCPSKVMVGCFK